MRARRSSIDCMMAAEYWAFSIVLCIARQALDADDAVRHATLYEDHSDNLTITVAANQHPSGYADVVQRNRRIGSRRPVAAEYDNNVRALDPCRNAQERFGGG
jgi:hypothetical protein